ncbi:MAG: hypothetical protein A4E63_00464 [Syntrophorhabdus sp. PtaU1.Bin050]|nr:MAG: hypothetical protein A4E63_00464 [Syntrophorhabdus sp. PtaU1.Bin050]
MRGEGIHAPGFAKGIKFVDKDNTWCLFLGLGKEVPYPGCTNPHEHFHKIRTAHAEKRHLGFPCHGLREKRFACPWRTDQKYALGYFAAEAHEFLRCPQVFNDLPQFFLRLLYPRYVLKGDLDLILAINLAPAFAEVEHAGGGSAHSSHEQIPYEKD